MMWVAFKMLTGDRAKFFGIIFGVAFAALLMSQQMSIFCGLMKLTTSVIRDIHGVDLWVMDNDVLYVDDYKPMPDMALYRVRGTPGVRWAVPFFKGVAQMKLTANSLKGSRQLEEALVVDESAKPVISQPVAVIGLDDNTLIGAPLAEEMVAGKFEDLMQPDSIFLHPFSCVLLWREESADLKKPADYARFIGRSVEINGKYAVVAGICKASNNFQSLPIVYTTYSRAKQYYGGGQRTLTYIFVGLEDNATAAEVSRNIAQMSANSLKARTPHEFLWDTIFYYIKRTGIPVNFFMTVLLGFLVGTAIAGQTFYTFTIENLKQFGALKAMGTSDLRILMMVLFQSMIIAPIGYSFGVGIAALFGTVTANNPAMAFFMPWQVLAITAAAVLVICLVSSLLSIRKLYVLEPAIVFRA
jgi:putative ABC transport system permease protein